VGQAVRYRSNSVTPVLSSGSVGIGTYEQCRSRPKASLLLRENNLAPSKGPGRQATAEQGGRPTSLNRRTSWR
jgi:hypothetical protein